MIAGRAAVARHGSRLAATGLALALAAGAGLAALPGPRAVAADDSAVTIAWAGGNPADLQQYQPDRDPSSIHHQDFENVRVTVSRTRDLVDEAVTVTVTGMPGPTQALPAITPSIAELGASFIQAMQCWGDPADPEFYKNCLFGAWITNINSQARPAGEHTTVLRAGTASRDYDVPFRAVTGAEYSAILAGHANADTPILQVMQPQTTNERHEMVDASGTAEFLFETQSAAAQPYLGCGDQTSATGTRCWLVIVPRGLHISATSEGCPSPVTIDTPSLVLQRNSPVNPACDYWANRVVVPLDFRPTESPCPPGALERLVVGTEAIQLAFSSWQAGLCQSGGSAYALSSGADSVVRGQLLSGQASMAITSRPLSEEYLPEGADLAPLAETELVYAPVAVTGVAIAFLANNKGVRAAELKLTPRLIAKLVTHSYRLQQGLFAFSSVPGMPPGPWSTNPFRLASDPEFKALNGDGFVSDGTLIMTGPNASDSIALLWAYLQADAAARAFLSGEPDNVLPGDEGNSGMTINPYYLPKGHPNARVPAFVEGEEYGSDNRGGWALLPALQLELDPAGAVVWREVGLAHTDGTPLCLCEAPVDTFMKADETLRPRLLPLFDLGEYRYDVQQYLPYASGLSAAAGMVFRGDTGSKTLYDSTNADPANGIPGTYVSNGLWRQDQVFLTGFTGSANAAVYGLKTASLQAPNAPGVFVNADESGVAAALADQQPTGVDGVTKTDPALLPSNAYPLTSVLYAAVNLNTADQAARDQYADLIEFAVTDGQVPGHSTGQLPQGYVPLSDELRLQALATAAFIRDYQSDSDTGEDDDPSPEDQVAPNDRDQPNSNWSNARQQQPNVGAQSPGSGLISTADPNLPDASGDPDPLTSGTDTAYSQTEAKTEAVTASTEPPGRRALGALLAIGLSGAVAGPLLLRRREISP
jgi:ABC-type phosphate transport system substrate-binding protein